MSDPERVEVPQVDRLGLVESDYVHDHPAGVDADWQKRIDKNNPYPRFHPERKKYGASFSTWREESFARNQFLDQASILKLIPEETLMQLLSEQKIYGIPDHDRILYPTYQFDPETRLPYPEIAGMIEMVASRSHGSPWEVHVFAEMPMIPLGGKRTSEVLYSRHPRKGVEQLARFIERYGNKKITSD